MIRSAARLGFVEARAAPTHQPNARDTRSRALAPKRHALDNVDAVLLEAGRCANSPKWHTLPIPWAEVTPSCLRVQSRGGRLGPFYSEGYWPAFLTAHPRAKPSCRHSLHRAWCRRLWRKKMENRAARYRNIAADIRARADNVLDERDRRGMLMAAEVGSPRSKKDQPPLPRANTWQPNT